MNIEHDSREQFYRRPFGAVTCNTEIRFRLLLAGIGIPSAVRLVYLQDGGEEIRENMPYLFELAGQSVYSVKVHMPSETGLVWYYFEVETPSGTIYYGNNTEQLGGLGKVYFQKPEHLYQVTVYDKAFQTPQWFQESVAYQIFVDRFYNGNPEGQFLGDRNDIIRRKWGEMPYYKAEQFGGEYLCNDFFGGNLEGVIQKLPYLHELGISVIYLNPIFRSFSNHKYDTGSYEEIDPMFGDQKTFERLCKEAKKLGIRILLDGVFNHTGSDSQYFNKKGTYPQLGAYQSKDSPYYEWFRFFEFPEEYESWWGMKTLPQVEENSKAFRDYILHDKNAVIKRWLKAGAAGWRLDVVDELPDFFGQELREEVKAQDPEAVIIGEVWEDASNKMAYGQRRQYFMGKELDSVMNYPMRSALIDAALGKIDAGQLDARLMNIKENYPAPAYQSLLNLVSSHDVERVLTMVGGAPSRHDTDREFQARFKLDGYALQAAKERACLVMGLQMTLPGVPCIFYGDEVGMQGYADPFCRQTYPWESEPDEFFTQAYHNMIALRNSSDAFKKGTFESVYKIGFIYGFLRCHEEERYIVLANFGVNYEKIRLDVARYEIWSMDNVSQEKEHIEARDGIYYIDMPEHWIKVYKAAGQGGKKE